MLQPLRKEQFDEMYALMESAFPLDERRPKAEQKALFDQSAYRVYCAQNKGKLVGFLAVWQWEEIVFIEHFAVHPAFRGAGLGGEMLLELIRTSDKPICLEVEPPADELTRRRIGFYQRHGFFLNDYPYVQPAISAGKTPIPLMLMTYPKAVTPTEFAALKNLLYTRVYKIKG